MTPAIFDLILWRGATFGPIEIICYSDVALTTPVDLTGWTVAAQVRENGCKHLVVDLNPVISDPTHGKIAFGFTDEQTKDLEPGQYRWDLLLTRPTGETLGPYVTGKFTIKTTITHL